MTNRRLTAKQIRTWNYEGHNNEAAFGSINQTEAEVWRDRFLMLVHEMGIRDAEAENKRLEETTVLRALLMTKDLQQEVIMKVTPLMFERARRSYSMIYPGGSHDTFTVKVRTDVPKRDSND
jgi:hypothetical protein